jgi:hypothetical protein
MRKSLFLIVLVAALLSGLLFFVFAGTYHSVVGPPDSISASNNSGFEDNVIGWVARASPAFNTNVADADLMFDFGGDLTELARASPSSINRTLFVDADIMRAVNGASVGPLIIALNHKSSGSWNLALQITNSDNIVVKGVTTAAGLVGRHLIA